MGDRRYVSVVLLIVWLQLCKCEPSPSPLHENFEETVVRMLLDINAEIHALRTSHTNLDSKLQLMQDTLSKDLRYTRISIDKYVEESDERVLENVEMTKKNTDALRFQFAAVHPELCSASDFGFIYVGGKWCIKFMYTRKTWSEARSICQQMDADLVTVESQSKQTALVEYIRKHIQQRVIEWEGFWIGAHDAASEGYFTWQNTNELFNYTSWGDGQPNSYQGNQDCVEMSSWPEHRYD